MELCVWIVVALTLIYLGIAIFIQSRRHNKEETLDSAMYPSHNYSVLDMEIEQPESYDIEYPG